MFIFKLSLELLLSVQNIGQIGILEYLPLQLLRSKMNVEEDSIVNHPETVSKITIELKMYRIIFEIRISLLLDVARV